MGWSARVTAVSTLDSAHFGQPPFAWRSSDTTVVVVDSTGTMLGVGPGTATVSVALQGASDSIVVRVVFLRADGGVPFAALARGVEPLCGVTVGGVASCRGTRTTDSAQRFIPLAGAASVRLASLSVSRAHQCGLTADGRMYCWGQGANGQFLNGAAEPSALSAPAPAGGLLRFLDASVGSTSSGDGYTCAVGAVDSVVVCAGSTSASQLGRSGTGTAGLAVLPTTPSISARGISSAYHRSCVVDYPGGVWCWGESTVGIRRLQSTTGPTPAFESIELSVDHFCAISVAHALACANVTSTGAIGTLTVQAPELQVARGLSGHTVHWVSQTLGEGEAYYCAVTTSAALYCWGDFPPRALSQRLGDRRFTPVAIAPGIAFTAVSGDTAHVCGLTTDGRILCI